MRTGWFGFGEACGAGQEVDLHRMVAVERRLSAARTVLATVSLGALVVEHYGELNHLGVGVLAAFALYSVMQAVVIHRPANAEPPVLLLHAADVGWALVVISTNDGISGVFFSFYVFALLAAGYRWGLVETAVTGGVLIVASIGDVLARQALSAAWTLDAHRTAMRLVSLLVAAMLIGYMSEDERRQRQRTWAVSRILSRVRAHAGLVASVQNVLDGLMRQLCARRSVLVLGEDGSDQVFVWEANAGDGSGQTTIRLRQDARGDCPIWLFDVPPGAAAWKAARWRRNGREVRVLAVDAYGARANVPVDVSPLTQTPFEWNEALCLSSLSGEGWGGRLFLFDPSVPGLGDQHLRFLQVVVGQVAPALFNLYLQRRLESRSGAVERAQVSRRLHDGVIQSLIGIEMQLEVLRRQAKTTAAAPAFTTELGEIQDVLSDEILNLRDLMQLLKPTTVDPARLVEHLTDAVAHFRNRTNIDVQLSCEQEDVDLPPRVCREVAGVVQEALANVRKHSGATSVLIRLGRQGSDWLLTIDDNGRGFGFDGTLDQQQLDAQHLGPLILKERLRSIRGKLTLRSQPGTGSRLDITIPGKHHA